MKKCHMERLAGMLTGIFLTAASALTATAQNFVTNGDFEAYNQCPSGLANVAYSPGYSSFPYLRGWITPTSGTPDFMHSCATDSATMTPVNMFGTQSPHSGDGYIGIIPYGGASYSEYISTRLSRPLCKDSTYDVSFFVSTAEGGRFADTTRYTFRAEIFAVNEIGLHFSDTLPVRTGTAALALPYHVVSDTTRHMTDTTVWYNVRGTYKARGGEQWITIGTFNHGRPPARSTLRKGSAVETFSYTYIDDVSIMGRGPQCATVSITGPEIAQLSIRPNPVTGRLRIEGLPASNETTSVRVTTVTGIIVLHSSIKASDSELNVSELTAGMYLLELQTAGGRRILRFSKH